MHKILILTPKYELAKDWLRQNDNNPADYVIVTSDHQLRGTLPEEHVLVITLDTHWWSYHAGLAKIEEWHRMERYIRDRHLRVTRIYLS